MGPDWTSFYNTVELIAGLVAGGWIVALIILLSESGVLSALGRSEDEIPHDDRR